ncbi:MAG TPA: flagellar FlbD family protein [Tepidisphaeraceae bacterium]|jgi:flagellar protein FlbD|nr:flagellar FlbD family protein [Tepidisphaeraceae bacterium]
MMNGRDFLQFIVHRSCFIVQIRMITLTRLNGQPFVINAEKIRYVEQTPDTVICCDNGDKMMVKEPLSEVMKRAIEYARLIRKPITE